MSVIDQLGSTAQCMQHVDIASLLSLFFYFLFFYSAQAG